MSMKRIRITRATVADRRPVMVGEVLDLPDPEAALLVAMRKAEEIPAADPSPGGSGFPAAIAAAAATEPGQAGETPRPSPELTTATAAGLLKKLKRRRANGPTG